MDIPLVEIELIVEPSRVALFTAAARSRGETPVCQRCLNEDEIIAGLLVIEAMHEQWALCGPCWRELPKGAHVV